MTTDLNFMATDLATDLSISNFMAIDLRSVVIKLFGRMFHEQSSHFTNVS
jgi:hypothetical protein